MTRFKNGVAALVTAAVMLGSPIVSEAASNIGSNEENVLAWIASNAEGGESSEAYKLAKDQFEYTTKDITAEQAETMKTNIKAANDLKDAENTADNQAKLFEYAQAAAKAAGGNVIALTDSESLESSVAFVRFDENNPDVIVDIYSVDDGEVVDYNPTTIISVDGKQYPIVNGATVTEEQSGYNKVDGQTYYLSADGSYQAVPEVTVKYATHVQSYGDQAAVTNGKMSGTTGESKRLESINIDVDGNDKLGITYTTHCQTYGWLNWSSNGENSGTTGESKRLEAIQIKLTGDAAEHYDVYYRVHAQSYGWLNWAKNGESAGTAGYAKRLEGIQIVVVPKWSTFDPKAYTYESKNDKAFVQKEGTTSTVPERVVPTVTYMTHVQSYGWQNWKANGDVAGTTGEAKRLEGIKIELKNKDYAGGITYTTHVQTHAWLTPVADGKMSGTTGEAKRLEAIQIDLTGEMKEHYDVYYRVHAQTYGWLNWAKNGESAGTEGLAKRLEGIQVVLVPKGAAAPANNYGDVTSTSDKAFIK